MKFITALLSMVVFWTASEKVSEFPNVLTEKLDGTEVQIPEDFAGEYTLIGAASSQKAEEELRTWQAPVYNKFIAKTGLMDGMYNVQVCFLPLFTGAAKMAKPKVVKQLRSENDPLVADHLYVYTGEFEPFKSLGMDNKKEPYFFLLDKEGNIVWQVSGSFRQAHLDEIESILVN
jgi:hypothetical protein